MKPTLYKMILAGVIISTCIVTQSLFGLLGFVFMLDVLEIKK